ncbi:MAG: hypothetical protein JWM11_4044 [Planctomycetaceae bacterium]|nr:hypothetical protein [Planctomycetaceae bacterium]
MTEPADPVIPPPDPLQDIHALLEEIRKQNRLLKQCLFVLASGLSLYLMMLNPFTEWFVKQIFGYAITVAIVLAILLTAPWWMRLVLFITDRIPGFPKSHGTDRDRP